MPKRKTNIYKRRDGRWEARYIKCRSINGKAVYGSVYGKTYDEAKNKLEIILCDMSTLHSTISANPLFSEAVEKWLLNNSVHIKGSTKAKYSNIIHTHIIPDIGEMRVRSIDSSAINSYLSEKLVSGRRDGSGGLSPSYVQTIMLIIKSTMKYASDEGWCQPLKSEIYKPQIPKKELCILTDDDQKKLEKYLLRDIDMTKVGIILSLYTGLRLGEVCSLQWHDIDLDKKVLHVRHTISRVINEDGHSTSLVIGTPKTRASQRDIPISNRLCIFLEPLKAKCTSEYVISSSNSFVNPRTLEYRFRRILKDCGINPINYHALRHTFATRCVEAGVDTKSLCEILGHSNPAITLGTYVHPSMELKRQQLEKLHSLNL